jgi:hypothetical protein
VLTRRKKSDTLWYELVWPAEVGKGNGPVSGRKPAVAIAAAFLCIASEAYAHGEPPGHIDEGPASPTWITVVMVVSWIVIALVMFFLVRRLIRQGGSKETDGNKQGKE